MKPEASKRDLVYERINPNNEKQIEGASSLERVAFGTGIDPMEQPEILRFIAKKGFIWLQYAMEHKKKVPTGVIEFIDLYNANKLGKRRLADFPMSPLVIIMKNQERVFQIARDFLNKKDSQILYAHGIAIAQQGKGYGTLLQHYAFSHLSPKSIVAFIDAAKLVDGELKLTPNENSFAISTKEGFILTGVVAPPVYDETITYYCFVRPVKKINLMGGVPLNLAEGDAQEVLEKVRHLTSHGYFGAEYNKKTHQMVFKSLAAKR